jgi:TonB family protein
MAAATHSSSFGTVQESTASAEPVRTARAGGFGTAAVVAATSSGKPTRGTDLTPVEILSKPRPVYPAEARDLRIEGEVLLEVLFLASGAIQVQRMLRGLGHGLDEAALASATQIRFRPAQHAGQPVDQTAIVHITFQLAY